MRFWDSSALVPLVLEQPMSAPARRLVGARAPIVAWWGSLVECWSSFARLRREGVIDSGEEEQVRKDLEVIRRSWIEIAPAEEIRQKAGDLLQRHVLRAGDALQLAAALFASGEPVAGEFVTFDRRLAAAADLEGLTPLP